MCFEQLPIEFDADGCAHLLDGTFRPNAFAPHSRRAHSRSAEPLTNGRRFDIDPVTRVAGTLAVHTTIDLANRVVTEAYSEALQFRGYELILKGRAPLEAVDISSRACGVCGGVHSVCSSMALEMAFGVAPPPLAILARNLGEAAELLYDHSLHLFLLAGPDYSAAMVSRTNPTLWRKAERTAAPNAATHGHLTIGDLMAALNPMEGSLYRQALEVTRSGREIVALTLGKYPHPSAVGPAGLGTSFDRSTLNQVLARIVRLLDFAKQAAAIWDDLVEFFYAADPAYRQVGVRNTNLISFGMWDDPNGYDATYAGADRWGRRRLSTPGAVVDGTLRTTALRQIDTGIEEFVDHSFYEQWANVDHPSASPDGSPLSPFHPFNKQTMPRPEPSRWKERYSWSTAPRWDHQAMEAGPLARQWITAKAGLVETDFIKSGDAMLSVRIPAGQLPEVVIEWRAPAVVNALERNRARAVHIGYCLMVAYGYLLDGFDYLRRGDTEMRRPFEIRDGMGVGFWEGGRGALSHYCRIEDGRLSNYQILTPSTWMASPRDPWGMGGPYEEAVAATPLLEECDDADEFVGIDILRAIRSFDPCLPCAVHLHTGAGTIIRDATTCQCTTVP